MIQHTKGPWEIRAGTYMDWENIEVAMVYGVERMPTEDGLGAEHCTIIAKATHDDMAGYHKQKTANAEFIVRACNSHYDLLEAATNAEKLISDFGESCAELEELRAAIAKATGAA